MVKIITAIIVSILIVGCAGTPVKLRTETVEVIRPILYCPAPDYTELNRPEALPTDTITSNSTAGEVAIRYKATVKILQRYIERLELTLDQYDNTNSAYDELRQELELKNDN